MFALCSHPVKRNVSILFSIACAVRHPLEIAGELVYPPRIPQAGPPYRCRSKDWFQALTEE
jgi:hypothetical protein